MKVLLVGAGGTLGSAVHTALVQRQHEVVTVGRTGGDIRADISDPDGVSRLYDRAGELDAVASAAGNVVFKPLPAMALEDVRYSLEHKVLSQVELVRQGLRRIAEHGSFTLITGVLARDPIPTSPAASMANGAVESFVRAAAIEIAPRRINAVSPTVFTESMDTLGDYFPGFDAVPVERAANAYVRSLEGQQTGRIYEVG